MDAILETIALHPGVNCVVFDAWVTNNGGSGKRCRYGLEFVDEDTPDLYLRRPNHICCLRLQCVRGQRFDDTSWHEDFHWAAAVADSLTSQAHRGGTVLLPVSR